MKPGKKQEKEIRKLYDAYWESYLKGDMKAMASCMDSSFTVIGSTEAEVFFNKKEAMQFYTATASQIAGAAALRNRHITIELIDGLALVTEQSDFYVLADNDWQFYAQGRLSSLLQKKQKGWKFVQQHGSMPDIRAQQGEQVGLEKISKENLELRDAVKRRTTELEHKNRELEIESSLERVRAVALSMNKPDDMLQVCRVISEQLELLKVKEIRNVQTAIFYEGKGTYMNYKYYAKHNKTVVTETTYTNNAIHADFAQQMLKGNGGFFKTHIKQAKIKDWIAYQQTTNVFIDDYLFTAASLDYYWYSLGAVALGISTYTPLTKEETNLFKRFLNVFELSYRRYQDIEKAEAQAREAQIQLALERVRARTMAMQKSDELNDAAGLLFKQVNDLGIQVWTTGFNVWSDDNNFYTDYVTSPQGNLIQAYTIDASRFSVFTDVSNAKKRGDEFWVQYLEGDQLTETYKQLTSFGDEKQYEKMLEDGFQFPSHQYDHFVFGSKVSLMFITYEPVPEAHDIFKRFGKVFEQTYTRFLDLQKAEAQAREAQIELALERIRAVAMAMKQSEELVSVCKVMYKELTSLGFTNIRNAQIAINLQAYKSWLIFEYSDYGSINMKRVDVSDGNVSPLLQEIATEIAKSKDALFQKYITEKEFEEWRTWRMETDGLDDPRITTAHSMCFYLYAVESGLLGISTFDEIAEQQVQILKRFKNVFELSYRRYADVAQAEAQAREAKIETALERVRSRSMGMQKSEELKEVIQVVYDQFVDLNINIEHAGFIMDYRERDDMFIWLTDRHAIPNQVTIPYFDSPHWNSFIEAKATGKDFFANHLSFEEKNKFYRELFDFIPGIADEVKQYYFSCAGVAISTVLLENVGLYIENFSATPYTTEENDTLLRFGKVFQQTYTRFNDLQKAEAQARENKIQLALERARTQSMIMQHSSELDETLRVFHQQVLQLGILSAFSFLWLPDEEKGRHIFWAAWAENNGAVFKSKAINYPLDRNEPAIAQCLVDWKGNDPVVSYHVQPEGVADYFAAWSELIAGVDELTPGNFRSGLYYVEAFMKHGCFGVIAASDLTPVEKTILDRFAKEFEQTYTRFLDLQKAEEQAKESQVQLALERVRARTMAMQQSYELPDAANILFQQVQSLGMPAWSAGYCIWDDDKKAITLWMSSAGIIQQPFRAPLTEDPSFIHFFEAYQRGETFYIEETSGAELESHYKYMLKLPVVGDMLNKFVEDGGSLPVFQIFHLVFFSKGFLLFITYEKVPEAHDIFKRFGKVFEQTYTRFLDLQKAEAQAREAQIEAGLEKVRSRSLAMHKSDELKEAGELLCNELSKLGLKSLSSGYVLMDKERKIGWFYAPNPATGKIAEPLGCYHPETKEMQAVLSSWEKHEPMSVIEMNEEETIAHQTFIAEKSMQADGTISKWITAKQLIALSPKRLFLQNFNFKQGYLMIVGGNRLTGTQVELILRFTKVFQQTYTRFLDLQKAETQTREARIEAAMEKVRSRAMAMQKPGELVEVAELLRKEMNVLGVEELETSSIYIHHGDTQKTECWYAIKDVAHAEKELVSDHMTIDLNETWVGRQMLEFYRSDKKKVSVIMQGVNRKEWINYCAEHSKVLQGFYGESIPDRTYHLYKFSNGYMGAASPGDISAESWDLLQRTTSVFSLAYTRFSDLQQAEAQAREAKIEAALERIRSRTLAMQKSDELAETAAEVFKQLISLGIEPNRLYIGIINGDTRDIEMWATDEDGTGVGKKFTFNAADNDSVKKLYNGWAHKIKSVTVDMQGAELESYVGYLQRLKLPLSHALTQKRRVQSVAYFDKGFIGMASPDEQSENSIHLLERFAAVFNLTFTRFNDLKIAEDHALQAEQDLIAVKAARKKAEEALTDLQAAQKQLVQSEKMASLGELTAGIAHEIQNPLNFVNNFSEVNIEMIEELKGERQKVEGMRNAQLEDELIGDIQQNMEKINHHGKRADAIVKGMLQHSRTSTSQKEPTDINKLADEYLRLAYHGLRAKDKNFNAALKTDFDETIGSIHIIPQDIGRVVLNLITNAFYAVGERRKLLIASYEPMVSVRTRAVLPPPGGLRGAEIIVSDNGGGIPHNIIDKIFQPFFTTKPTGQGTGLGLSLAYDIIKAHGGTMKVESIEGEGTTFTILLPV